MATRDYIVTKVRYYLGEETPVKWSDYELERHIISSIQKVQALLPVDAIRDMLRTQEAAWANAVGELNSPVDLLAPLGFWCEESDSRMGRPWDFVDLAYLQSKRSGEDELGQDSTDTRLWAMRSRGGHHITGWKFEFYPIPIVGRDYRLSYIKESSTEGEISLPIYLYDLVVLDTVAKAAAKKSLDLPLASWARNEYREDFARIEQKYKYRYGIDSAEVSSIRNVLD